MGYYSSRGSSKRNQRVSGIEMLCVLLAVAAVVGLVVWVIATAGGGVLLL